MTHPLPPSPPTSTRRRFTLALAVAFASALVAARVALAAAPQTPAAIPVVATTTLVADLVQEIGGDRIRVDALMGPGVDPHLYKASARDVTRLSRAEGVFYSGLFLEGRMEDLFQRLASGKRKVFAATADIPKSSLIAPPDSEGHPDPHVWGDPALWKIAARTVARGLAELDPAGAHAFQKRLKDLESRFDQLSAWAKARVEEIPPTQRVLITSHDAFSYFGRAFGLEVVGVQGISTASEAGLADITKLADLVRSRSLKAVFVESSVAPAAIERISRDSGARVGGELFSDALGRPGDIRGKGADSYDVGTYAGMLKHNINTVVEALK
ncbi:MAG: metal ABC transporter solute-binding protein, Zn/Mn family [Limisphaerales bacterium]